MGATHRNPLLRDGERRARDASAASHERSLDLAGWRQRHRDGRWCRRCRRRRHLQEGQHVARQVRRGQRRHAGRSHAPARAGSRRREQQAGPSLQHEQARRHQHHQLGLRPERRDLVLRRQVHGPWPERTEQQPRLRYARQRGAVLGPARGRGHQRQTVRRLPLQRGQLRRGSHHREGPVGHHRRLARGRGDVALSQRRAGRLAGRRQC